MDPADWLGDADRAASLGRRLTAANVPIDRLALYRRTLHPAVLDRATAWSPNRPVEIFDREHGLDLSPGFVGSPLDRAIAGGGPLTMHGGEIERSIGSWANPLRSLGLYTLLLVGLSSNTALALGTCRANGFSETDNSQIARHVGAFAKGGNRQKRNSQ